MAVINDVAKHAGVSKSTVSKFLNNPEALTQEYRERVAKAVNDLKYVPNNMARSMRTKKTMQLVMIVPSIATQFFSEVFTETRNYAAKLGYRLYVVTVADDNEVLNSYIDDIGSINADGGLIAFLEEEALLAKLSRLQNELPIALIASNMQSLMANSVVVPLNESIYGITKYLIDRGYKDIAFLGGPAGSKTTEEKVNGYIRAIQAAGLPAREELIRIGEKDLRGGYFHARELLRSGTKLDAIVAATDEMAIGAVKYLQQNGYRIPEDIAVTGHDGTTLSYLFEPGITTQEIPVQQVCQAAVDLLVDRIKHPGSKSKHVVIPTRFVERRSTNPEKTEVVLF